MVDKFNKTLNMNIIYGFFKNRFDEFNFFYKKWKMLMSFTSISVDPDIYASDSWCKERESISTNNLIIIKTYIYIYQ